MRQSCRSTTELAENDYLASASKNPSMVHTHFNPDFCNKIGP
jgi:hypothetical protein